MLNLNATQMFFDVAKVKSGVNTQEAKLMASQAQFLVCMDNIALQVASYIVNIKRYQEITRIAREQIKEISRRNVSV